MTGTCSGSVVLGRFRRLRSEAVTITGSRGNRRRALVAVMAVLAVCAAPWPASAPNDTQSKFEITFPNSAHTEPITGRVFVTVSPDKEPEPRLRAGSWGDA